MSLLVAWPLIVIWYIGPLRVLLFIVTAATISATADAFHHKGDYTAVAAGLVLSACCLSLFIPRPRRRAMLIAVLAMLAGLFSARLRVWVLSWRVPA